MVDISTYIKSILLVGLLFLSACSMDASIVDFKDSSSESNPGTPVPDDNSFSPIYKNPDISSGEVVVTTQGSPGYVFKSSLYKISEGEMVSSAYRIQVIVD